MKILIADDESEIRKVLRLLLESKGYEVTEAEDGVRAAEIAMGDPSIDLVIMDVKMPKMSGIEATEKIRSASPVPVLFLTAKSLQNDKSTAYAVGGDDYLVKPFSSGELLMKVQALTRRYTTYRTKNEHPEAGNVALSDSVSLSIPTRTVTVNGETVDIRDREMDILIFLATHRGRVVSPTEIYEQVWGEMALPSSANTVTVHILNLRRKLETTACQTKLIRTVWGKGYQID